jgi:hypothetical protein
VNPNKLQEHLDQLIGPMSDTDSLSSADDAQFKSLTNNSSSKRTSSSVITSSTNNSGGGGVGDNSTLNNGGGGGGGNVSSSTTTTTNELSGAVAAAATKSFCVMRTDKLDTSEIKDLLICCVYILKHISQGKPH